MFEQKLPLTLASALRKSELFTEEELDKVLFKRFDGGHHNDIFRVQYEDRDYSVRLSKNPNKRVGYFTEEFHNLNLASKAKIAPIVLYSDDNTGTLIYRYIEGRSVTREDLLNPTYCGTVTRAIKSIHLLEKPFLYKHNFLQSIRRREAKYYGESLENCPDRVKKLAIAANRAMELIESNPVPWTPCHADLILDNMLKVNSKVVIIDWELSGMSDPHEDLANFICFGNMTKPAIGMILAQYFQVPDLVGSSRTMLYIVIILYYWILRHAEDLTKYPDNERMLQKQQRRINEAYTVIRSEDYKAAIICLRQNAGKEYKSESKNIKSAKRAPTLKKVVDKEYKSNQQRGKKSHQDA